MKPKKSDLLVEVVEHIDIKEHNVVPLVEAMSKMAFSARDLGRAAHIYDQMLQEDDCAIILCLAGSLISAGLKQVVVDLVLDQVAAQRKMTVRETPLLAAFYRPWAAAVQELVEQRLRAAGRAVLLDVHSYPSRALPYELHAAGPRPAVCLGVDPVHTPPWLLDAARRAFSPLGPVAVDSPFRGTYVPLDRHGRDRRVSSIMVELRRDTEGSLVACVEDDGRGFDPPAVPGGRGFANMRERLAALDGSLELSSSRSGTRILVRIPVPAEA